MTKKLKVLRDERGFTMVELVLVMAIIAILATIMLSVNIMPTLLRSRDTKRKADLASVAKALEAYVNDYGRYPEADIQGRIEACGDGTVACSWGSGFVRDSGGEEVIYMGELPKDNRSPSSEYRYATGPDGKAWKLYARLENSNDPVVDTDGDGQIDVDYGVSCGTKGNCNYGISSSNVEMGTDLGDF